METISNWFLFLLVNSTWQITAIVLVSIACDRFFRDMPARLRHMLWVASLLLCVGVPIVGSFGVASPSNSKSERDAVEDLKAVVTISPASGFETADTASVSQRWRAMIPVSDTAVVVLFGAIATLIFLRMSKVVLGFRRMIKVRRTAFAGDWSETDATLIADCKTKYGVEYVEIFCSTSVSSPVTLGALRPVIVLPETMLHGSDPNILISAVSHELNHVRRRDYLKNLFYELIYLPISFHPAAALVKRRIRETRELACDEYVTDTMVEPADYARSLVSIAGMAMDLGRTANITIGILDDDALEKRIMKILDRRKITASRRNLLLGSATLVFVLAIVAAMSFSFTPVVAQQKGTPDSETERLKKVAEELRRKPSQQAEDALKKAKAEIEPRESEGSGDSVGIGISRSEREEEELAAKREAEIKVLTISQADLAKRANITMTQAINIATAQEPGTVMETKIVFEKNGGETEEPFYVVTIVVEKDGVKSEKRVIVSGIDGSVGGPHNN